MKQTCLNHLPPHQMLSDALYKSPVDQLVKVLVNTTGKHGVPTFYYLLNTTVEALKYPFWREVSQEMFLKIINFEVSFELSLSFLSTLYVCMYYSLFFRYQMI